MEVDHQTSKAVPKIQKVFSTREFDKLVLMMGAIRSIGMDRNHFH